MTEICGVRSSVTSSSTSRASCLPSRRSRRIRSRPSARTALPEGSVARAAVRRSTSRSSAAAAARSTTRARRSSFTRRIAASTRSRAIESTSRPTYPTSVNFEASTFTNGRVHEAREAARDLGLPDARRADHEDVLRRRSRAATSTGRRCRRHRSRRAIATARLAFDCPTTCRSSSATIFRGERSRRVIGVIRASRRGSGRSCRCRSRPRSRATPSRSSPRRGSSAGAAPAPRRPRTRRPSRRRGLPRRAR